MIIQKYWIGILTNIVADHEIKISIFELNYS